MDVKFLGQKSVLWDPADWLSHAAARHPTAPALYWGGQVLNYRQLHRCCGQIGADLRRRNARGRPLALSCGNRLETALGIWAALGQAQPVLPLKAAHPQTEQLLRACEPGLMLHGLEQTEPLPHSGTGDDARGLAASNIRLIVATSGSSGDPKGVMLSAGNLASAVAAANKRIPLNPGDIWLNCLSLEHIGGLSILLRCIRAGAGVLLHPSHDTQRLQRDLRRLPVTHVSLTPAMLHRLLRISRDGPPPHGLRHALIGGAALDPALEQRARAAGWPLRVSYGMSETASQAATRCSSAAANCVGHPLDGFQISIDNPDPRGAGEIRLRGPALMAGYANPALAPGLGLRDGWLHSGDLGCLDPTGRLYVLGRLDDRLNSGGVRLHPAEIEPVLRAAPGVDDAILSARPDPVWGDLLVAVYSGDAEPDSLLRHCRDRLPKTHWPRECLRLPRLPYLDAGKPDRGAVRRRLQEASGRHDNR